MIEPVKYHRDEDCNIIHKIYRVNKYIENNWHLTIQSYYIEVLFFFRNPFQESRMIDVQTQKPYKRFRPIHVTTNNHR